MIPVDKAHEPCYLGKMLREIKIANLAIVPECEVRFERGLNVLTGETGAGKSILLDAIGLLAGKRAQAQDVREGAASASVEGVFAFSAASPVWSVLEALGIPREGDEIFLRRVVGQDGRSRAFVNDVSTTVTTLADLAVHWLDLTGQHAQQRLLDAEAHAPTLDGFLGLGAAVEGYAAVFRDVRAIDREIAAFRDARAKTLREKEYHEFRLKELEDADLKAGEDQELAAVHQRVGQKEKLVHVVEAIDALLDAEDGVLARVGKLQAETRAAAKVDPSTKSWEESADSAAVLLRDLHHEAARYRDALDVDPAEIERVNERLALLQRIGRKFGSLDEAIAERDRLRSLLSSSEEGVFVERALLEKRAQRGKELALAADVLTKARAKGAKRFAGVVTDELVGLGMPAARLEVRLEPVPASPEALTVETRAFGPRGAERVEFHFSPNPGESPKPLEAIASGGELSRVLLALKGLGLKDEAAAEMTFVFDEVDAGIGGQTAERVGRRMNALARGRQVLCVTHLAQVACYADFHLQVTKSVQKGRTISNVAPLDLALRKKELARMIGGIEITRKTQEHADELLLRAQNPGTSPLTA